MAGFNRGQMNWWRAGQQPIQRRGEIQPTHSAGRQRPAQVGTWVDPHEAGRRQDGHCRRLGIYRQHRRRRCRGGHWRRARAGNRRRGRCGWHRRCGRGVVGQLHRQRPGEEVEEQAAQGGLLLWVGIQNRRAGAASDEILERRSGREGRVARADTAPGALTGRSRRLAAGPAPQVVSRSGAPDGADRLAFPRATRPARPNAYHLAG